MKRLLSFIVIAIAVCSLIMVSVVPHHHHGRVPCFAMEYCDLDHVFNDLHTHHHGDTEHEKSCISEHYFALPGKSRQDQAPFHPIDLFAVTGPVHGDPVSAPSEITVLYDAYLTSFLPAEPFPVHGLRAPPVLL